MACMDHRCTRCEWSACDNERHRQGCPRCGARLVSFFDEPREREDYDWEGDVEEDDDAEERA